MSAKSANSDTSAKTVMDANNARCKCGRKRSVCTPKRQQGVCFYIRQVRCEICGNIHLGECRKTKDELSASKCPTCGKCHKMGEGRVCWSIPGSPSAAKQCQHCKKTHPGECWMLKPKKEQVGWRNQLWRKAQSTRMDRLQRGILTVAPDHRIQLHPVAIKLVPNVSDPSQVAAEQAGKMLATSLLIEKINSDLVKAKIRAREAAEFVAQVERQRQMDQLYFSFLNFLCQ